MMHKALNELEKIVLGLGVFLIPIILLPVFPNQFVGAKNLILIVCLLIVLVIKAIKLFISHERLKVSIGPFDLSVTLFALSYVIATWTRTPNKMEAILFPGTTTIVIGGSLLYFFLNQLDQKSKTIIKFWLIASATVVSITSLVALAGIISSLNNPRTFSPAGGNMAGLIFLVITTPLILNLIHKHKDMAVRALLGICLIIIGFGVVLNLTGIFSSKNPDQLPSLRSSWFVMVDTLKTQPLLGIGPGNYLTAYNRFRPQSDNYTAQWATRFTAARNFYLTVVTETGLLGMAALVFLGLGLLSVIRKELKGKEIERGNWLPLLAYESFSSLLVLLLLFFIFPGLQVVTLMFFVLLALSTKEKSIGLGIFPPGITRLAIPGILIAFVLGVSYYTARITLAESQFKQSLEYIRTNDAKGAYDTMRAAILTNPYVDRYRFTLAQLNVLLATNLAQKKELSDSERNTISQLLSQAVQEGKNAVALNPERASNWEGLAAIYKTIIPLAKGADKFALQTYSQAILLDPTNVNTRIALGGLFYTYKNYDAAIDTYKLAVVTKNDHANAHYNLALAYREKGDTQRAQSEFEVAMNLIKDNAQDKEKIKAEIDKLKQGKPSQAATPSATTVPQIPVSENNISNPDVNPNPVIEPQIDLGNEASPPATPQQEP